MPIVRPRSAAADRASTGQRDQSSASAASTRRDRLAPGDGLIIGLLMGSTFVVLLNEMLLGVALPTLIADLQITAAMGQWLTTGYLLTLAVLIPATGFVMRKFHMRTIFLTSMSLFAVGTALAALAPGVGVLFAGRLVQAAGTAVFLPLLMTTVMRLVPEGRRGQVMAFVVVVTAAAPALGPAASGLVLSQLSWRWLFILMLPVALVSLGLGAAKLRNITTPEPVRLDVWSLLLSAVGFGALVYGLASIGESLSGHTPVPPYLPLVLGVVGVGAFVMRQRSLQGRETLLLDVRIFAVRPFAIPALVMLMLTMTAFGSGIVFPLVLTNVNGLGPLQVGLFLVPGGVAISVVSAIGGRIYDRVGPRPLVIPGALVVAATLWFLTQVSATTSVWTLLGAYIVMIVGQALMWSPLTTAALSSLPSALYPHGSAAFSAIQQLGGAAGTAILVSAYTFGAHADTSGTLGIDQAVDAARAAFTAAALIACVSVIASLFVRRAPAAAPDEAARPGVAVEADAR